jgi:predicted cupin superfamily sugar epimerase
MDHRAAHLIDSLGLVPHPEGGYYREIYRSDSRVQPLDDREERSALTTIYFLLGAGQVSRWHRVASDELWHYCEGASLELFVADPAFEQVRTLRLGTIADGPQPVQAVRAGDWQAARSCGAYTLAGCTVGPGFEFADFQMLRDRPEEIGALQRKHPQLTQWV